MQGRKDYTEKLFHIFQAPGASHEKAQLLSNKKHYNPHDPDARISVMFGKARKVSRCATATIVFQDDND